MSRKEMSFEYVRNCLRLKQTIKSHAKISSFRSYDALSTENENVKSLRWAGLSKTAQLTNNWLKSETQRKRDETIAEEAEQNRRAVIFTFAQSRKFDYETNIVLKSFARARCR